VRFHLEKSVRQELDYQVVTYSPYVSREDLRTIAAPHDSDSNGDCGIYRGDDSASSAPSLVVNDEFTMIEGAAICMYLADLYGQFLPENEHRAEYYRSELHGVNFCLSKMGTDT